MPLLRRMFRLGRGGSGGATPAFFAPFLTTLVPSRAVGSGTPTFARATTAWVEDHEGILREVPSGAARFQGARLVRNMVPYSQDLTNGAWLKLAAGTGVAPVVTGGFTDPSGGTTAQRVQFDLGATPATAQSRIYQGGLGGGTILRSRSFWAKTNDGTNKTLYFVNGGGVNIAINVTGSWQRFEANDSVASTDSYAQIQFGLDGAEGTSNTADIVVAWFQVENVSGASVQTASEYVSTNVLSAPYHGAGADGVKYFSADKNGAAISSSTLKGVLIEGASENLCLQSQNLNTTPWANQSSGTVTVTEAAVAAPDGTTTGCRLVGSAANTPQWGLTAVTTATAYTMSFWAKKNDAVTTLAAYSGGTLLGTATLTSAWQRFEYTFTPSAGTTQFGFRLSNNQDCYVWGVQIENTSYATSYIPTTTVSVQRAWDNLSYASASHIASPHIALYGEHYFTGNGGQKTVVAVSKSTGYGAGNGALLRVSGGAAANAVFGGNSSSSGTIGNLATGNFGKFAGRGNDTTNAQDAFLSGLKDLAGDTTFDWTGVETEKIVIGGLSRVAEVQPLNGTARNVKTWKVALSDAKMKAMTV